MLVTVTGQFVSLLTDDGACENNLTEIKIAISLNSFNFVVISWLQSGQANQTLRISHKQEVIKCCRQAGMQLKPFVFFDALMDVV